MTAKNLVPDGMILLPEDEYKRLKALDGIAVGVLEKLTEEMRRRRDKCTSQSRDDMLVAATWNAASNVVAEERECLWNRGIG